MSVNALWYSNRVGLPLKPDVMNSHLFFRFFLEEFTYRDEILFEEGRPRIELRARVRFPES